MVVQDVDLGVGDGASDGGDRLLLIHAGVGGIGGVFGGAVEVGDMLDVGKLVKLLNKGWW